MNGFGLTISDKGHVCAPGEVSAGCSVANWLKSSLVPPVPNWLLVSGLVWWGFSAAQSRARGRR